MKTEARPFLIKKAHMVLLTLTIITIIILGAVIYFRYEANSIREIKRQEMKVIAEQKVNQIGQWQKERIANAMVNSRSPYFIRGVEQWLNNRSNKSLQKDIYTRLELARKYYEAEDILIASPNTELIFSLSGRVEKLDSLASEKVLESAVRRGLEFTDLYKCSLHNKIHYDVIAPIINQRSKVIAVLIYRFDPNEYLYPLINSWPVPSKTAEIIIIKRQGDYIAFLNHRLRQNRRAFDHTIDIRRKARLAVKAVEGYTGLIEGKDYRGEAILAYTSKIPNTQWYILAKISQKEVYAEIYSRAIIISIFTFVLIIMVITGIVSLYNIRQKKIYKELLEIEHKTEEAIRQSEARLNRAEYMSKTGNWEILLNSGFMTASEGAARIYGIRGKQWDLKEVQQIPLAECREKLDNALQETLESGKPYDVEFKIKKAGTEEVTDIHSIAEYDKEKRILFGVIQDVTERKQAEETIRKSLKEKESLLKEIHHRVKNNLQVISSLLSLQTDYIENESLRSIFVESRNRVKTMAMIHEKLYQSNDFSQISLSDYLTELVSYLEQIYMADRSMIEVKLEIENIILPIDTAIPIGLIVNEIITNSLKYAFPGGKSGVIVLSLCKSGDEYKMHIWDNGVGLGEGFDINNLNSIGLMLVSALTSQIKGKMDLSGNSGTHCRINFPAS